MIFFDNLDGWNSTEPRLAKIESAYREIEKLRKQAHEKEQFTKELILNLERELYNGLTFREYIKTFHNKSYNIGNIRIQILYDSIHGEYKIPKSNITLTYKVNIQKGDIGYEGMHSIKKSYRDIPYKYTKQIEELIAECHKYQIDDITRTWRILFGLDEKSPYVNY